MFRKVLVAIDRETLGADAIALATRIAPGARLSFAHVHNGFPFGVDAANRQELDREASDELLAQAIEACGLEAERCQIDSFRIGAGLHRLIDETHPDLLVIGSTRTARVGRVLVTDELAQALNGAPCALAVAPLGYSEDDVPLAEIGVAYDGAPESVAALVAGMEIAERAHARSVVFRVAPLPHGELRHGVWDTYAAAIRDRVAEVRVGIENELETLGVAQHGGIESQAACGETVEELALFSSYVDLLLLGSRGYGPPGRLVYGATTARMLRNARTPLLLMPRAQVGATLLPDRAQLERWAGTGPQSSASVAPTVSGRAR